MKVEVTVLSFPSRIVFMVSVDVKQHGTCRTLRSSALRSRVKVDVAVLGSSSLIAIMVSVDVKQHLKKEKKNPVCVVGVEGRWEVKGRHRNNGAAWQPGGAKQQEQSLAATKKHVAAVVVLRPKHMPFRFSWPAMHARSFVAYRKRGWGLDTHTHKAKGGF